jgi:hypothetical protein
MGGRLGPASQRAVFSPSSARIETAHCPAASTAAHSGSAGPAQNRTSGGSSETDVNVLTAAARPALVVTITTPLAN